jgi:hypothetical protein
LDINQILTLPYRAQVPLWRHPGFEVFRWSLFPDILIFDIRSYAAQNRLFHRLAFYAEKTGFRGKLHPDAAIEGRHGWNAHNYSAANLAGFFTMAREAAFPLNEEELWLAAYLESQGVITKRGAAFVPGKGGVLSVSRESSPETRQLLLTHESLHGVYYCLPGYRSLVEQTWEALPQEEKDFWEYYFTWMGYDISDGYLLVNEFQAYLLQQPLSRVDSQYKGVIAERLGRASSGRRAWLSALFAGRPEMFTRPARIFSDYLLREAGIEAGNTASTNYN